ncbi:MAG TPA: alanine--glyoxylate aminotransferase family protein [Dehalococcoidia bacterium]|nr:alanine--glyoxylate aminotransferase family protein [Dehalococcoidia bacterium]
MFQPPQVSPVNVPQRLLLGPGPSNLPPRVQTALSLPVLGHLDPEFFRVMDETSALLRYAFQTRNELTLVVPGTGTAGMQAAITNAIEPGDRIVVGVAGFFGHRIREMAERLGAEVDAVEVEWGRIVEPDQIRRALDKPAKVVAIVHGETSTGVEQPIAEIGRIVREHDALFLVDTVASLGGVPVYTDEWLIDICYSGSQKSLAAPPGLAPITFNDRAIATFQRRRSPQSNFYLDIERLGQYWDTNRAYHHTSPASMIYALHEAGRLMVEEGLPARWERHARVSDSLVADLAELGLHILGDEAHRLKTVAAVRIPEGVPDKEVRRELLRRFNIEIGGGLGPFGGKLWRIGVMGHGAHPANYRLLVTALAELLAAQRIPAGQRA